MYRLANIFEEGDRIIIELTGNGFLYNMVRIICVTIIDVGLGKIYENDIEYRSKLIGREGRLFAGVISTRFSGIALGLGLAVLLMIVIPFIAKLCGL